MTATPLPEPWLLPGHDVALRPPLVRDVDQLVAACRDEAVQWFTRVPADYGEDDAMAHVALAAETHAEGGGALVVLVDPDDTLLGTVGLSIDRRDHTGEVGYWMAPAGRGRGLATAAVRAVCDLAFDHCGVAMLHLVAATENPGSIAVAERAGFRRAGLLRSRAMLGPTGAPDGPRSDMLVFDLLPGDRER